MRILTPFEFISLYPENLKVVFVGNAPSLKGEKLGKWIDAHDLVVRFNECPTVSFEKDVGARTDILITNPYPEGRASAVLSDNKSVIIVIAPQTRRGDLEVFTKWAGLYSVLFTYSPDLVQIGNVDHKSTLTTGTYGIHLLTRLLKPKNVSVVGFTMFLKQTAFHYFKAETPKGLHAHDTNVEAKIFIQLCNSIRCPLEVSSDIEWVSRMVNIKLRPEIKIKLLTDKRWSM